jgi:8-oxo-dGTP diphosphatase
MAFALADFMYHAQLMASSRPGAIGVAVDIVALSLQADRLAVLLVKLKRAPYEGRWGLPGGRIGAGETLEAAAARELLEKTGLRRELMQVRAFSAPDRDPAGRCISVAFLATIAAGDAQLSPTSKYAGVAWFPLAELQRLPYDHEVIVAAAADRLRELTETTAIAATLLPPSFTLGELQRAHEAVLGVQLDARNFRKQVAERGLVVETGEIRRGGRHRPAKVYRVRARKNPAAERGSR